MTTHELTDDERAALQASSGWEYTKADALLHAACDVIVELHRGSPLDEESHVLQALLYVFVERCMRRGLNPAEELELWFATMDLPPISRWEKWRQQMRDVVIPDFLRECAEQRTEVWHQIKDAALRALTVVAAD